MEIRGKVLAFAAALCTFISCGNIHPDDEVPAGTVRIFADKTEIVADGVDVVNLRVMYGSENITSKQTLVITVKSANGEHTLAPGVGCFSTNVAGKYTFTAKYYYGGDILSDNSVTVEARDSGKGESKYYQKMLGMQFTSVLCPSCPALSKSIEAVQDAYPGRIVNLSFHVSAMGTDPMALRMSDLFFTNLKVSDGLPAFTFNVRKSSDHIVSEYGKIVEEMERQLGNYPASCGVALDTSVEGEEATITVKITSETASAMKYHLFIVEDGLEYDQMGADSDYRHNNVVRWCKSDNIWGINLNGGKALEPGKEYTTETKVNIAGLNVANTRVVAVAMSSLDGGNTYGCNNLNECDLGKSAGYVLDEPVTSNFVKHICVMEFTGQWCAQCPEGARTLQYYSSELYPGIMHVLAFHDSDGGADDFEIPEENKLYSMFKYDGYPGYVIDMKDVGVLTSGNFGKQLEARYKSAVAKTSVQLKSVIEGGKLAVDAELWSKYASEYRLAAYIVEDKIVAKQNVSGNYQDNYTHRHVVRKMLSSDVRGDALGSVGVDAKKAKTWTADIDPSWNKANLSVCILAIDSDGYVDNVAECTADGGVAVYGLKL